ncbi:MAG: type II toxin-antitoxin system VapC family toxin [Chloroflexota bacterium]
MRVVFADTSAIVRAYLLDEADHAELRRLVLEDENAVLVSEIARVEFARAMRSAARARRIDDWAIVVDRFDADCQADGPIRLVELRPRSVLRTAQRLVLEHQLGTLDAIHLAVAIEEREMITDMGPLVFLTRDDDQATAARAEGFEVL